MMRKPSIPPFLWPWLMSLLLSWGAVATLVTAFDLPDVSLERLFWYALLLSGGFSLVMTHKSRWWTPVLLELGLIGLMLLVSDKLGNPLLSSVETLLYRISLAFNRTYFWGVLHWSPTAPTASAGPALLLIMGLVSLVVSQTVCHRNRVSVAVLLSGLPLLLCMVARDTVPDSWCVWLLFVGLGLLMLTGSSRRMNPEAGRRLTALVLIPTILATSVLFWILPPSGYNSNGLSDEIVSWIRSLPFWASSSVGGNNFSGDSAQAEVDLSSLGNRVDTPALAMTIVASRSGKFYLRGRGYDYYDGKTWTATTDSNGKDPGWSPPKDGALYTVTIKTETPRHLLYFPGNAGVDLQEKPFMKGYLPNRGNQLEYTFHYGVPREYTSGDLKDPGWLALPTAAQTGAAAHLETILQGVDPTDTAAVAQAIEAYVEASAEYSFIPSRMPADAPDFAMWFLEDAQAGYCVHFATAATVLLRAAGIPARYVTGYCVDVPARQTIDVWERHAHAWVEYFQPEVGWTILDATPGYPGPDPLPTEPPETTDPTETIAPTGTTAPTDPTESSPEATQDATTSTGTTEDSQIATQSTTQPAVQEPTGGTPDWVKTAILWLLAIAGAIAVLIGQYRLRIWARRRYLLRGDSNRQGLNRYRLIRLRSRLLKKPIPPQMTDLAEKAKFSQHKLTKAELQEMDQCLNTLAGELTRNSRLLRFLFAIE